MKGLKMVLYGIEEETPNNFGLGKAKLFLS